MPQFVSLEAGSAWPYDSRVADEVLIARTAWNWALPQIGSGFLVTVVAFVGQRVLVGAVPGTWGNIALLVVSVILAGFLAISVPAAFKQNRQPVLVLNNHEIRHKQHTNWATVPWSKVASVDFRSIVRSGDIEEDCLVVTMTTGHQLTINIEELAIFRDKLDFLIEVFRERAARSTSRTS